MIPVPHSLIRYQHHTVASYDSSVFLDRAYDDGGRARTRAIFWILMITLVLATMLLSVTAAQADPAKVSNQATFVSFSSKATFGKPKVLQADKISNAALARLKQLERLRRLSRKS